MFADGNVIHRDFAAEPPQHVEIFNLDPTGARTPSGAPGHDLPGQGEAPFALQR